jgi:multiple antibiotic resistance protein
VDDYLRFTLVTFTSVLFIVDPIAAVPAYLVITQDETAAERRRTALRACVAMTILLIVFAATGTLIFRAFGITLPAFRAAGGLILWIAAMDMLRGERPTQEGGVELQEGQAKEDVALTPLAIPLLAGPGAIATVTALMGRAGRTLFMVPVVLSIAITCAASYAMLRAASQISRVLGVTGLNVMNRVIGLIIGAIAVQFVFDGLKDTFPRLFA